METQETRDTKLRPDQGMLAILDRTGDTKVIWSRDNRDEVDAARETFNRLRNRGFLAYKVTGKDGNRGEQMYDFDPNAERIIMSPAMQGG